MALTVGTRLGHYEIVSAIGAGGMGSACGPAGGPQKADAFVKLFMVPGMHHCGGGPGPNTFDMLTPLENWVEHGAAPAQVVASHAANGVVDRTRPLCPHPQVARYVGSGSVDAAENFRCEPPRQGSSANR